MEEKQDNDEISSKRNESLFDQELFSDEEIRMYVKSFVMAYMNDRVKVDFSKYAPKKNEEIFGFKYMGNVEQKHDNLKKFRNMMQICTGIKSAKNEKSKIFKEFFKSIIEYRINGWIEGSFMEYSYSEKISEIEYKIEQQDKIINGYVQHLREDMGI